MGRKGEGYYERKTESTTDRATRICHDETALESIALDLTPAPAGEAATKALKLYSFGVLVVKLKPSGVYSKTLTFFFPRVSSAFTLQDWLSGIWTRF